MRIIAGKHRSRRLKALEGDATRPTTDKVKEAIFSSIGPYFDGGSILDLFGGSGSIGLEAISRGMEMAYIVDCNLAAIQVIKENVKTLKEEARTTVIKGNYEMALQQLQQQQFSMVFLDPPYKLDVAESIIEYLLAHNMLEATALVVVESSITSTLKEQYGSLKKQREKQYGISKITYFRGSES